MYLKALGNIPPLTNNLQSAFYFLMNMLGSTRAKLTEMHRRSFAEAMQEESLVGYFSLFAHLAFHYIYIDNTLKYTEFLDAIRRLNPKAQEDAILLAFSEDALGQGGWLLEARHKVQEDRRRLMTTCSSIGLGVETLLKLDARLTREEEELKKSLLPIHALFALIEKIVGLCIEKGVLDEAEVSIKEKINADPARWIMRLLPIFAFLRQGRADKLPCIIKLTLNLIASRALESTIGEIQKKLTELKWVEIVPSPPEITCPEPGSELDKLVCCILKLEEPSSAPCDEKEEEVQPENAAAQIAALAPAQKKFAERDGLRIFAILRSARKAEENQLKIEQSKTFQS